eukprot:6706390-Prymnesium_polylepis.4
MPRPVFVQLFELFEKGAHIFLSDQIQLEQHAHDVFSSVDAVAVHIKGCDHFRVKALPEQLLLFSVLCKHVLHIDQGGDKVSEENDGHQDVKDRKGPGALGDGGVLAQAHRGGSHHGMVQRIEETPLRVQDNEYRCAGLRTFVWSTHKQHHQLVRARR